MNYHQQPPIPPSSHGQFRRILKIIIITFIILCAASALTILAIFFHPQRMQLSVSSASLRQFSFNSSSPGAQVLAFNLSANLAFRNPNDRIGIYYDRLQANVDFDGVRFGWAGLPGFYQGGKGVTEVAAEFGGQSAFGGGAGKVAGIVGVDLWVNGRVRFRFGRVMNRSFFMRAFCPLELPLGKTVGGAYLVDCDIVLNP